MLQGFKWIDLHVSNCGFTRSGSWLPSSYRIDDAASAVTFQVPRWEKWLYVIEMMNLNHVKCRLLHGLLQAQSFYKKSLEVLWILIEVTWLTCAHYNLNTWMLEYLNLCLGIYRVGGSQLRWIERILFDFE